MIRYSQVAEKPGLAADTALPEIGILVAGHEESASAAAYGSALLRRFA